MFVTKGAKEVVLKKRQNAFMTEFLPKVWEEAKVLEISKEELMNMIRKITKEGNDYDCIRNKRLIEKI